MNNYYTGNVTNITSNQVFVFGANQSGFHGAGSAGYASFGVFGNHWRKFDYGKTPWGTKGKWNVKGKTQYQEGNEGSSYGLVTVTKAGAKRSITPSQLKLNIQNLYLFALKNTNKEFLVAQSTKTGLNGYTGLEMATFFGSHPIPENVKFEEQFYKLIQTTIT